jgi:hypothetical protein
VGPTIPRYVVPLAALLVTFIAGALVFFAILFSAEGDDEVLDSAAVPTPVATATIPASPTSTIVATATPSPRPAAAASPTTIAPTPTSSPSAAPTQVLPPAQSVANFAGSWRLVDTVVQGRGAGETYAFFVTIRQADSALQGGAPGAISLSGTVAANVATVEFSQPTLGVTGIFIWTMNADGNATGTFTSSIPNSGTSHLLRVR